jgi:hypothetical protein
MKKKMKSLIPAAVAALLCAGSAQALGLIGIEVGAVTTPAALAAAFGMTGCQPTGYCINDRTVTVVHTRLVQVRLEDWRVHRIYVAFDPYYFDEFDKALRDKLGPPPRGDVLPRTLQNGFGALYQDIAEQWNDAAGNNLFIERYYGGDRTFGAMVIKSAALLVLEEKEAKGAASLKDQLTP